MDISVLNALTELFSIIAHIVKEAHDDINSEFIHSYFQEHFGARYAVTYVNQFNEYLQKYNKILEGRKVKYDSLLSVKLLNICDRLNFELSKKQKIQILITLLLFVKSGEKKKSFKTESINILDDSIKTISESLKIEGNDCKNCKYFINDKIAEISSKKDILIICSKAGKSLKDINSIEYENFDGEFLFFHIKSINLFLCTYKGGLKFEINNKDLVPGDIYIFDNGSYIAGSQIKTIYYTDILTETLKGKFLEKNEFSAEGIAYTFSGSKNGIHKFSFFCESGHLVAIMGPSGAGKSTLLNLLIGKLTLQEGRITVNGYDLTKDKCKIKDIIGYVPQDDLLINELTVYQNLYYNSKLYLGNVDDDRIRELVKNMLVKLDLFKIKKLKVGTPIDRYISGGERKRLNIAMELIREPSILFLDEPTSGLSSSDSKKVIQILKNQTLEGKLIILNIHQPSSEVFKLFNKLLIFDKGGFPIFYGNPLDALTYFRKQTQHIQTFESECPICGNVNPEEIFQIIEEKDVNEYGELTEHRKFKPFFWYKEFLKNFDYKKSSGYVNAKLWAAKYKIASPFSQFQIFLTRNVVSKLSDKYYLFMTFLVPPFLAVILGFFTKYIAITPEKPHVYKLFYNENLPSYLFMCVLVALFLGLIISAEEIISDSRIIEKEEYLNLNKLSYYNSKIIVLFFISTIQLFVFVVIGNRILKINNMNLSYCLILITAACFANLLGLLLSSTIKSVVAIYIAIPLILIPQILLSGVILKYDKLYEPFISQKYVPVVGDIMISRWAFEALVVNQYKNNNYTKRFFDIEKEESNLSYDSYFLLTELSTIAEECKNSINKGQNKIEFNAKHTLLRNEIEKLIDKYHIKKQRFDFSNNFNILYFEKLGLYLQNIKKQLLNKLEPLRDEKDKIISQIPDRALLEDNNEALCNVVLNRNELNKIIRDDKMIIRKFEPIYQPPESIFGRAQFFASEKRIGKISFDTVYFNVAVIWLINLVLYFILVFELPVKTSRYISLIKKRKE